MSKPDRKCFGTGTGHLHIGPCCDFWADDGMCVCDPVDASEYPVADRLYIAANISGYSNPNIKTSFPGFSDEYDDIHYESGDYMWVYWDWDGWYGEVKFELRDGSSVKATRSTRIYAPEPEIDPCKDVVCNPECVGMDLYSNTCIDGICVRGDITRKDSTVCGFVPEGISFGETYIFDNAVERFEVIPLSVNDDWIVSYRKISTGAVWSTRWAYFIDNAVLKSTIPDWTPEPEPDLMPGQQPIIGREYIYAGYYVIVNSFDCYNVHVTPTSQNGIDIKLGSIGYPAFMESAVLIGEPEPDPCVGVVCDPMCVGTDKYSMVCVGGSCVRGSLMESNSLECDYVPPSDDIPDDISDDVPYVPPSDDVHSLIDSIGVSREQATAAILIIIAIIILRRIL